MQTQAAAAQTGTVDRIDFTMGGAGNQWTTIDGVRYATWWDFSKGVRVGRKVSFTPYSRPFWHGQPPILSATIHSVEDLAKQDA